MLIEDQSGVNLYYIWNYSANWWKARIQSKSRWFTCKFSQLESDKRLDILPYLFTPSVSWKEPFQRHTGERKKFHFRFVGLIEGMPVLGMEVEEGRVWALSKYIHVSRHKLPASFLFNCYCARNLCSQQWEICRPVTFITRKSPGCYAAVVVSGLF